MHSPAANSASGQSEASLLLVKIQDGGALLGHAG